MTRTEARLWLGTPIPPRRPARSRCGGEAHTRSRRKDEFPTRAGEEPAPFVLPDPPAGRGGAGGGGSGGGRSGGGGRNGGSGRGPHASKKNKSKEDGKEDGRTDFTALIRVNSRLRLV